MQCPECSIDLKKNATSCACGWNQGKVEYDRPPMVEDDLIKVLGRYMAYHKLPDFMPPAPVDAARWWMEQQEQPKDDERPRQTSIHGGEGRRWICPYHMRVSYTLEKFLNQMTEKERRIIMAAGDDNIFWRGEEMDFFMLAIEETGRMRKMGTEAYRIEAIDKMKNSRILKRP